MFAKFHVRNVKRFAACAFGATLSVGVFQGYTMRQKYFNGRKIEPPKGATSGIENWLEKFRNMKDGIKSKFDDDGNVMERVKGLLKTLRSKIEDKTNTENDQSKEKARVTTWLKELLTKSSAEGSNSPQNSRKVKLLVLGDSLVAGVGCELASPILPKILATVLSLTLKADVEWKSEGVVGGTVQQLRQLLPSLKEGFLSNADPDTEYIVVIICGLNDWRAMLENFPFGSGPESFKRNLQGLITDIRSDLDGRCKVFLPALPFTCGKDDPDFILETKPLSYLVQIISHMWDVQKHNVAFADKLNTTYICSPDCSVDCTYATPGAGNVCADGIHPSTKGYTWWALHIAESIVRSRCE